MGILANATPEEQWRAFKDASAERLLALDAHFEAWAHTNRLPPNGEGWRTWLMMAGRGFGKTRAGAEWIFHLGNSRPGVRIALAGATIDEARAIMVEGVSGLISVARRNRRRLQWEPSLARLKWPNGSEARLFSGDNADGFRVPEHDFAWCDELAKWRQAEESWMNLQMALRRGPSARALVTTTPRPMPLLEQIQGGQWTVTTTGRTKDNINLDEKVIEVLTATYGSTRIGAQELDGVLLREVEGALWTREVIERARADLPANFDRIVVGVDPPAGGRRGRGRVWDRRVRIGQEPALRARGCDRPGLVAGRLDEPGRGGRGTLEHGPSRGRGEQRRADGAKRAQCGGLRPVRPAGSCLAREKRPGRADRAQVRDGEGVFRRAVSRAGGGAWQVGRRRRLRGAGPLARPCGRDGVGNDGAERDAVGAAARAAVVNRIGNRPGPTARLRPGQNSRRFGILVAHASSGGGSYTNG